MILNSLIALICLRMNYIFLLIIMMAFSCSSLKNENDQPPNVLLIAVDDLNDWVGCLGGHPDTRNSEYR